MDVTPVAEQHGCQGAPATLAGWREAVANDGYRVRPVIHRFWKGYTAM
ncbi:MAG: hypothetical protein ACLS7Z_09005 [Christensenellales bacterium]